jgi:hypothetical protein
MKIAVHILAYNVNRFLKSVLLNVEPHVDKIYIAYPEKPFSYNTESYLTKTNPTKIEDFIKIFTNKVEVVKGEWDNEEDMRNSCFEKAKNEGFDWFLIQDADEFYTENSWKQIKKILFEDNQHDLLVTTWFNFWKSSHYVLVHPNGDIKYTNAGFAIKCKPNLKFISKRLTNAESRKVIDYPCFHYGYVMSDIEMYEKLKTWSHSKETNIEVWYKYKWLNWNSSTVNLHPVIPSVWEKAIRFPFEQPEFAAEFALDFIENNKIGFNDLMGDIIFNFKESWQIFVRNIKKFIKSII